jgi:hypothetical protein
VKETSLVETILANRITTRGKAIETLALLIGKGQFFDNFIKS